MNQESIMGMVLSATPVGDYDKRLVILTREHGKIAAFAKGARRPNCALLACSQPFAFGTFQVYQGKTSYTVVAAEITNYFETIRMDLDAVYYATYFCEFMDFLTKENIDGSGFLKLLYQSLRALSKKTIPYALIRYIFEFKSMVINGEAPQVFECVKCANEKPGTLFSAKSGGLVCEACKSKMTDIILIDEATVYTLQYIVASKIEKLYTFHVSECVMENLRICATRYLAEYLAHTFNSLRFLDMIVV
ncbi:MAG: DNA repair protein RecO [Velocimicrobium sp.]